MNTDRTNAAVVGVLFLIGTVTGTLAAMIGKPILDAPDTLTRMAAHEGQILVAAFLLFLMGIACAGIGLALYPILKQYSAGRAIGTVGFRVIEGTFEMLGAVTLIGLLALSRAFVQAGAPDATYFQTLGAIGQAADEWLSNGATLICWCIGAFLYYSLFYQYRLVPRWLSGWGLVGITLATLAGVLVMLQVIPGIGTVQMLVNLPIALQELVFAVWLIAKGVHPPAAVPESA